MAISSLGLLRHFAPRNDTLFNAFVLSNGKRKLVMSKVL